MAKILKEIKDVKTESVETILKNPDVEQKKEEKPAPTPEKPKKQTDAEKLDELYKLKEMLKKEVKDFDDSRKAKMDYKEAKAHRQALQKMRAKVGAVREQIFELKQKINVEKKASTKISQTAMKQARFLSLYKKGISISNITHNPDGVKAEDLEKIMTQDFLEELDKFDKRFIPMWNRWKDKFLQKKD